MPSTVWPWGVGVLTDPSNTQTNKVVSLNTTQPDAGEFSFNAYIPTTLSSLLKNQDRLQAANATILDAPASIAWYNFPARISAGIGAYNDAFQGTLTRIIILVVVVAIVALFGLSFVQAKGVSLAK